MIRVGSIKNSNDTLSYPDFEPIYVMTKSSKYGKLSPYLLKTEDGILLENKWQFSKLYPTVPKTSQTYSRWNSMIIWEHPAEVHAITTGIDGDWEIQEAYWSWRNKGFNCKYPVRYPVGYHSRHNCICAFETVDGPPLDYIESRKKIYVPDYNQAVVKEPLFNSLKKMLSSGKNLLILEVDGPKSKSLSYYQEKYGVADDFIDADTCLATPENLDIFLNDDRHPYGHGFCLASALITY